MKPPPQDLKPKLFVNNSTFPSATIAPLTQALAERGRGQKAGAQRGAQQREQQDSAYAPWVAKYQKEAAGKDRAGRLRVRNRIVKKDMETAGFLDPISGKPPDERTIRRRFPTKI
jgi:hypothetical protein